ncbi:protease modulator HflC [Candidatus Hydrogenedentota bacterium]
MLKVFYIVIGLVAIVVLLASTLFTVDETEYAIVTTFGKLAKVIKEPGLQCKLPSPAQRVIRFDKRLQVFDPRPTENFTLDRKNLVIDCFACWRIADPERFLVKVQSIAGAENSLAVLVASELATELGKHELSALVSMNEEDVKLEELMDIVTGRCRKVAETDYGIDVLNVSVKRINFPDANKNAVYERMRAERQQKAKEYRAGGEEQAMIIRGDTDQERREILAKAYKESQEIKGEGDAEAIRIYAQAYNQDPKFYKFMRTLASYKKILYNDTTLVMSSDAEFLKLLTNFDPAEFGDPAHLDKSTEQGQATEQEMGKK